MTKGQMFLLAVALVAGFYGELTDNFLVSAVVGIPASLSVIGIWVYQDKKAIARDRADMRKAVNNH